MASTSAFHGVLTALVTPMTPSGEVNLAAFDRLVDRQVAAGIHGLVPCGTTGESPTLTAEEQHTLIAHAVERSGGRVPVMAGIGSNNTRTAIANGRRAQEAGVQGVLATTPYYNKPTQEGIFQHFTAIADALEVEVCVYDVPGRSVVKVEPETLARLAEHPNIRCVKDATGDLVNAVDNRRLCGPDFTLLSGDDFTLLPFWAVGGHGCISVLSNVCPARVVDLHTLVSKGRYDEARASFEQLFPLIRALFIETNPSPIKAALAAIELCADAVRLPLVPASDGLKARLHEAMAHAGLLGTAA
ncbi:MAG: 4-hydroxy-tetrahydrodipicolinate synthase [Deltaproteobacteria bacterium]|nr:4-hydroxy-tetrahydrodipicolinate synthase [Deltaproteobacteria bacterium]HCH62510.1 4-hydroxy-tetrahydrodipicolinate synthase [Deltaproteobacteria bacterium]